MVLACAAKANLGIEGIFKGEVLKNNYRGALVDFDTLASAT
jgi:hypothetical protein